MKKILFKLLVSKAGFRCDRHIVRLSGYSIVSWAFAFSLGIPYQPTLFIRTVGRRSGLIRSAVLPYSEIDGAYFLVGSNGGSALHPSWAVNMMALPVAWLWVKRRKTPVRAALLEGGERDRVFEAITKGRGPYVRYQSMAQPRQLPVFRLTPFSEKK